jgi:hypothetical protein
MEVVTNFIIPLIEQAQVYGVAQQGGYLQSLHESLDNFRGRVLATVPGFARAQPLAIMF